MILGVAVSCSSAKVWSAFAGRVGWRVRRIDASEVLSSDRGEMPSLRFTRVTSGSTAHVGNYMPMTPNPYRMRTARGLYPYRLGAWWRHAYHGNEPSQTCRRDRPRQSRPCPRRGGDDRRVLAADRGADPGRQLHPRRNGRGRRCARPRSDFRRGDDRSGRRGAVPNRLRRRPLAAVPDERRRHRGARLQGPVDYDAEGRWVACPGCVGGRVVAECWRTHVAVPRRRGGTRRHEVCYRGHVRVRARRVGNRNHNA